MRDTRPITWLKLARKEFEAFPAEVQIEIGGALTVAAEGGKSDNAKPFKGVGAGVFEIAVKHGAMPSASSTRSSLWWK